MKIKEVLAGVKISKNYNSYSINLIADLEVGDNPENIGNLLIEKAKEIVNKKITGENEKCGRREVGAAWFSRDSGNKLSVQYSKQGKFKDVDINELDETGDGFRQVVNGNVFIFRRIPDRERRNNKMPVFRIYQEENHE